MSEPILSLLAVLSPLLFAGAAFASRFQPGRQTRRIIQLTVAASMFSIVIAAVCGILVYSYGLLESDLLGVNGLGLSVRLDPLSVLMSGMIALLGFIVVRFSGNYLDGDPRQGIFMGRLAATIASVQLLVLAGNLGLLMVAWVLTSLSLHRLLIFYPERRGAVIAARKKFIVARVGDICLLGAILLLYNHFGTGKLEAIFSGMKQLAAGATSSPALEAVAVLIALAAILKSAQFPTHGWLVEVMETPTPVSALLHAGLLNAGPFLVARMAFLMDGAVYAPVLLIIVGGFTALFASVVFLTQTSVKTALGYSSVAHMGFMLLVCGLGVYPAAILHLVAHSFYKAHAFLSSGSIIDTVRASKIALPKRLGSPLRVAGSILLALAVYLGFSWMWGIDPVEEMALLATGAIIVMGLSQIIAPAMDSDGGMAGTLRACLLAVAVATAFFALEDGFHYLLHSQIPGLAQPGTGTVLLIVAVLVIFGAVIFIQILAPSSASSPFWRTVGVHFRNGLYANALFDRLVGSLSTRSTKAPTPYAPRRAALPKQPAARVPEPEH